MKIKRTTSSDKCFIKLVSYLDQELKVRDGADHDFYHQFNKIDMLKHCVVFYVDDIPAGCGAIKEFEKNTMEVKRMYVLSENRNQGIATQILAELENWTKELGSSSCVLETGLKQPEAIALYKKAGYVQTPNYGQYIGVENSVCFKKELI